MDLGTLIALGSLVVSILAIVVDTYLRLKQK